MQGGAKLSFRLALLLALASVCLSSYVLGRAQSGPSWEVPVAVVEELQTIPVMSTFLAVLALVLFIWGRRRMETGQRAQWGMVVALLIAFALPWVVWLFDPAQWPFRNESLSFLAFILIIPAVLLSIVGFWLIGFRWLRDV